MPACILPLLLHGVLPVLQGTFHADYTSWTSLCVNQRMFGDAFGNTIDQPDDGEMMIHNKPKYKTENKLFCSHAV